MSDKKRRSITFMASTLPVGGAETHLIALVRGLEDHGFDPSLVLLKDPGELGSRLVSEGRLPVLYGLKVHGLTPRFLRVLTRELRRRRPEALITLEHDDVMLAGRLVARFLHVPRVITIMHTTTRRSGSPTVSRLFRLMKSYSDTYVATAQGHRHHLVQQGLPAERVVVIENGVDTERFRPSAREPSLWTRIGLPPGSRTIGMVAAFRPEKSHELVLHALATIRQRRPDAHLLLFGDGPLKATIEQAAHRLGVAPAVHWLGVRHDLERWLPQLDLAVLASSPRVETLSFAMLESMACGRPVVVTDVGFLAEAVADGVNGRLIPAGSANGLAAAVIALLDDPEEADRMGQAARRTVEARYSLGKMLERYAALLTGKR
ncbi:MAG: glycosyltransferase [Planctomycetota bacterium]